MDHQPQNRRFTVLTENLQQNRLMSLCRDRQDIRKAGNKAVNQALKEIQVHAYPSNQKFYSLL